MATQTRRTSRRAKDPGLWAIVLAAGDGKRLAPVTRRLYGWDVPKQFAALDGDETLLQQTINRLAPVASPRRTVVVVAAPHAELARLQLQKYDGVQIVSQPANAGTGPGIMLPMSMIRAQDPTATVIVTPSDHHVPGTQAFVEAVRRAREVDRRAPAGLVLLGADAEAPAPDLGWIVPQDHGAAPEAMVDLVQYFVEKPPVMVAEQLFLRGALWNTLVVLGSVRAFWDHGQRCMPHQTARFDRYVAALNRNGGRADAAATELLERLYRRMPPADFSRSVLQNARGLGVVRLRGSGWCDCGTPDRLLTCLPTDSARRPAVLDAVRQSMASVRPRETGAGLDFRPIVFGQTG